MNLVVRHDADRAYFRKESVIEVRGWARDTSVDDTTTTDTTKPRARRPLMRLSAQPQRSVCDTLRYTVTLFNSDTLPITITDARIRTTVSGDTLSVLSVPRVLAPGQSETLTWVLPPPLQTGLIRCIVRAGIWTIDTTQLVQFVQSVSRIALQGPISAAPNDTVTLRFSGRWEKPTAVAEVLRFRSSIPQSMLVVLQEDLQITRVQSTRSVPVRVAQIGNEIQVESLKPLLVDQAEDWHVEIPCLAMLSQQNFSAVKSSLYGSDCYAVSSDTTTLIVGPVCAEDVRRFSLADVVVHSVYPVPAGDVLHMEVESKMNEVSVSVQAVDVLGRKFMIAEKLFLRKGLNSLIFDTHSLTGGYHRIELRSRDIEYQIPIMFFK